MLKVKHSNNSKLKKYVKEFSENIFSTDGLVLCYKVCDVKVSCEIYIYISKLFSKFCIIAFLYKLNVFFTFNAFLLILLP